jgi:hypothetical protein
MKVCWCTQRSQLAVPPAATAQGSRHQEDSRWQALTRCRAYCLPGRLGKRRSLRSPATLIADHSRWRDVAQRHCPFLRPATPAASAQAQAQGADSIGTHQQEQQQRWRRLSPSPSPQPPSPAADMSAALSLDNIRSSLIRQEDTIIFSLIERSQVGGRPPGGGAKGWDGAGCTVNAKLWMMQEKDRGRRDG